MQTDINPEANDFCPFSIENISSNTNDVVISDFRLAPQTSDFELMLQSTLFTQAPHSIKINGNKLSLIIEEVVNTSIPDNNVRWNSYFHHSYVRFHHLSIMLPSDEFSVQELKVDTTNTTFKVILKHKG